jgi:5'-deoxynucleotidase YfbR-like HD superfamily hydrolase
VKHSPDDVGGFGPQNATTDSVLSRALTLARISLAFGRVERATRHEDGVRVETDTDHTVMLGLVACELAPRALDRAKVAAFALVHDLVEVYAGDTQTLTITPEGMAAKREREDAARVRLTGELGAGSWLASLLATYEEQRKPEARFVRLVDKVLPKLTHAFNGCVAAVPLTDRAGFVAAHARQFGKMREEYPEFVDTLDLLYASMLRAEGCWQLPEGPSLAVGAAPPRTSLPLMSGVSAASAAESENR